MIGLLDFNVPCSCSVIYSSLSSSAPVSIILYSILSPLHLHMEMSPKLVRLARQCLNILARLGLRRGIPCSVGQIQRAVSEVRLFAGPTPLAGIPLISKKIPGHNGQWISLRTCISLALFQKLGTISSHTTPLGYCSQLSRNLAIHCMLSFLPDTQLTSRTPITNHLREATPEIGFRNGRAQSQITKGQHVESRIGQFHVTFILPAPLLPAFPRF